MATKTNLRKAVEAQADDLQPAQREIVKSQLRTYEWNVNRIASIESTLKMLDCRPQSDDPKRAKADLALRKELRSERHQLTVDNTSISSKLMMHLKNTGAEEDEFDSFMKG